VNHSQKMRLAYIDWRLMTHGSIRRGHIAKTFGVSEPQASADIQAFLAAHPEAVRYDKSAKRYVPANGRYRSQRGWTARRVEVWAAAAAAGVEWAWRD
jgi:hypothetical protein